jgi:hypothetical protein
MPGDSRPTWIAHGVDPEAFALLEQRTLPWIRTDLLSVSEVARKVGLSAQMVRVLCNTGQLAHVRLGKRGDRFFAPEDVEDLALNRQVRDILTRSVRLDAGVSVRYPVAARRR